MATRSLKTLHPQDRICWSPECIERQEDLTLYYSDLQDRYSGPKPAAVTDLDPLKLHFLEKNGISTIDSQIPWSS